MREGYTVFASDEARREFERRPKPVKRKSDCPSCEIKKGTVCAEPMSADKETRNKEGDK